MTDIRTGTAGGAACTVEPATAALQAARALAPEIRARAREGERLRTMPSDLADRIEAAGLFALGLPRSLGGLELDPATIVRIVEEISYADGSAGWSVLIGMSTAFFAWLEPSVARELIADHPYGAATNMLAPTGSATPQGAGAFRVSGRWAFNTGVRHARFSQVAALVLDEHGTSRTTDRGPQWRVAVFPTERGQVLDTWDGAGLRGTGSHDLVLEGLSVPAELFVDLVEGHPRHDGPLWRFPLFAHLNVTLIGFPLGVARRALDEFAELARTKTRGQAQRRLLAEDPHVQLQLATAEGELQSARAFAFDVIGQLWDTACAGNPLSLEQRAQLSLATQQATRAAVAAVDGVFRLAGAGALYADQPLQRCFRDLHALDTHANLSAEARSRYAKHLLGVPQPPQLF